MTQTVTNNVTVTFTGTKTTTINAAPAGSGAILSTFLGLPTELWIGIVIAITVLGVMIFRFQVKGVPVVLLWIYKNYTG